MWWCVSCFGLEIGIPVVAVGCCAPPISLFLFCLSEYPFVCFPLDVLDGPLVVTVLGGFRATGIPLSAVLACRVFFWASCLLCVFGECGI